MECIMAVLTDKQQTFARAVFITSMSTYGASLARVVGIHLDDHRPIRKGFVGDHGLQFGKRPLRVGRIGFALFLGRLLALLAFRTLADMGQIFQSDKTMWVSSHDAFGDHMIGVLLQPSLSSADRHQATGCGASAFFLKTLSQSRVMVGFRNNGFARMEGLLSTCGAADSQVANADIHTSYPCLGFRCGIGYLNFQRNQQVELLTGLVIPQFGSSDGRSFLDEGHVLVIARIGNHHASIKSKDAHSLFCFETVVSLVVVGQGRRNILGRFVQSLVTLLGQVSFACKSVLLHLRPQPFVGRTHLTRNVTSHLCWQTKLQADVIVAAFLQGTSTACFAMLKGVLAHRVQGISIRQLRLAQCLELFGRGLQFELGCEHLFHRTSLPDIHALCQETDAREDLYPTPITPRKERSFLPRLKDGGGMSRFVEYSQRQSLTSHEHSSYVYSS